MTRTRRPELDRYWDKVVKTNTCWIWTGGITGSGYGIFMLTPAEINGTFKATGAHRYGYELAKGPIPDGMHIDHLCRVPSCVNPDHLEAVTPRTNTLRGVGPSAKAAKATVCKHGHPLTEENVWFDAKRNTRHCRPCMRRRFREWYARSKAAG